jgi:hypothetical protein
MAAIVSRHNPKPTWPTGLAGVRATARGTVQRTMAWVGAAIMLGAVGAALLQVAVQLASFPAPIAVPAITLLAAALLNSLRRHLRTRAGHRSGAGHPHSLQR